MYLDGLYLTRHPIITEHPIIVLVYRSNILSGSQITPAPRGQKLADSQLVYLYRRITDPRVKSVTS